MKTIVRRNFSLIILAIIPLLAHTPINSASTQENSQTKGYWDHIEHLCSTSCAYENQENSDTSPDHFAKVLTIMKPQTMPDISEEYLLPLIKDLHVVHGTDHHAAVHLLSKIDRTTTLFGRAALCYRLANPITNTKILKQRQAIVQAFLDDPMLLADCQILLLKIKDSQQKFLDFLLQDRQWFPEGDALFMSTMDPWGTTGNESMPTRLLKKVYSGLAAANNIIARKINNSEIPYAGSYPLESLMWWRKFWAFWPIGLQIGVTALAHAYYEPKILAMDERDNAQLATLSSYYDHIQAMSKHEWDAFHKQHNLTTSDQHESMRQLDKLRQEFMQVTKVGVDGNAQLAKIPGLITQQAQENAARTHQKLAELPSFSHRTLNATGMMTNLLFNPAHPSRMTLLGWPLRSSEYNTMYGYAVKFINFGTIVATNLAIAAQVKKTVEDHIDAINKIRVCLCTIRDIENARRDLYQRLSHTQILALLDEHHILSGQQLSHTCIQALDILQSSDLDQAFGVLTFGAGAVLTAYKNLREVKHELYSLMRAVGEVDLYVSLAQLYKEHASFNVHYTFAIFDDNAQASLQLTDVWNPFIDSNTVVPNSISMGLQGRYSHMLLTGSNTGGKSTLLRAIALAALMAQTISIVPASYAHLTPFDDIIVLLNVSDDPTNKESTFAAEGSRARGLLQRVTHLSQDQRALIFIDELFKGTSHQEGLKWACAVTHYLARSKSNIITLFATHFHELTHLERSTQGRFKNYHLDAQRTTRSGSGYSCSYQLQEGPCTVNIASDIMRQKLDGFEMGDIEEDLQQLLRHST